MSFHLAHRLLTAGFSVFAELLPTKGKGRIDLLGIAPNHDWFVVWDMKAFSVAEFAPRPAQW